jgi:hypothetical protein
MSACETVRFIDDKFGLANSEALDMDMVMWECDTRIRIPIGPSRRKSLSGRSSGSLTMSSIKSPI